MKKLSAAFDGLKFSEGTMKYAIRMAADNNALLNMENHMVGDLNNLGYQAVSCLQEYGPKAFDKMTEAVAISKLKHSGVDAILTFVLFSKSRHGQYVPAPLIDPPYASEYNRFWLYHSNLPAYTYAPAHSLKNTRYFWESNLYIMQTQHLMCSAQTESFDPYQPAGWGTNREN